MCPRWTLLLPVLLVSWALAGNLPVSAQLEDGPQNLPDAIPPPLPPPTPPKDAEKYEPLTPRKPEIEWGTVDKDLLGSLKRVAKTYEAYSKRFVCDEAVRDADYKGTGEVSSERVKQYGYLLVRGDDRGLAIRELRQEAGQDGNYKPGEVKEPKAFPPAYAWVFLFSDFHAPYFDFRHLDTYFDGFDLVHEIQFKGSLPFSDGRDIRQWEGTVLIDAFKHVPLEVRAEPKGQEQRLEEMYRLWAQSWNILGFRTKQTPFGHKTQVRFGSLRDELSFPTELRYDKFKAVGPQQIVPVEASTHAYSNYRFTSIGAEPELGGVVEE